MTRAARSIALAAVICVLGVGLAGAVMAQKPATGPALETPAATLAAALHCPPSLRGLERDPVLLVQGTWMDGPSNWSWNYLVALPAAGFATCYVELPDFAGGDIQVASEYVVHAIRAINGLSGRKVAVIGYSQGGLEPRWAMRWWPDVRALVSDSISFASTHHGTELIDAGMLCAMGCPAAIWQQRPESRFLAALNAGGETFPGVDYTAIYTTADMTVTPPAAASSLRPSGGARVTNVALQEICPEHGPITGMDGHLTIIADAIAYALVLDALRNDGPADPARIARSVCARPVLPGIGPTTPMELGLWIAAAFGPVLPRFGAAPAIPAEPPLKPYAR
jgi:triacylglycerol esterase/lipase EstA (alpha/beta hydrolase family)